MRLLQLLQQCLALPRWHVIENIALNIIAPCATGLTHVRKNNIDFGVHAAYLNSETIKYVGCSTIFYVTPQ
jgi:hypothetical protein